MKMAKRLMALMGVLALTMATAVPAFAESEPQLTGVIEKPEATTYMYGTHSMTDEVGGDLYALQSDVVDLDAYVGQRVTVFGAGVPGYENGQVEGGPSLFDITRVEPADGPAPGSSATFTYELAVECEPPAGAEFLGFTAIESLVTTPLTDPDGDGVYTGSQSVLRFAPGGPQEPIEISPVRIVQGPPTATGPLGPEYRIIKDFGAVTAQDTTLSASVSFCDGGGSTLVSGDANDDKGGVSERGGANDGTKVLPSTGGILPVVAVGALLLAGGLVARRIIR